jgi:hypothetical protein
MHTHSCLASIAELELNTLLQDTRNALDGLQCQRESAVKALEMVQDSKKCSGRLSDETDAQVTSLVVRLHHLDAALDLLKREIELIEDTPVLPDTELFIVLPLSITQASKNNRPLAEAVNPHRTSCSTR